MFAHHSWRESASCRETIQMDESVNMHSQHLVVLLSPWENAAGQSRVIPAAGPVLESCELRIAVIAATLRFWTRRFSFVGDYGRAKGLFCPCVLHISARAQPEAVLPPMPRNFCPHWSHFGGNKWANLIKQAAAVWKQKTASQLTWLFRPSSDETSMWPSFLASFKGTRLLTNTKRYNACSALKKKKGQFCCGQCFLLKCKR